MGRGEIVVKLPKTAQQAQSVIVKNRYKANLEDKKKNPLYRPLRYDLPKFNLSMQQLNKMRMMYESGHAGPTQLSKLFGLSAGYISQILRYEEHIIEHREKSLIEMQYDGEIVPDHT